MTGTLSLIWDYDAAIGQINATYPYKFDETKIIQEIKNVNTILELGEKYKIRMTFACLGCAAEEGHYPYHIPDQIRKIHTYGHEIASHSWKHEWFPYLEKEQIIKSLSRSKFILEQVIGIAGTVTGFVPPFNRPMSWIGRGALSLGDRVIGPWYPGSDFGSLLPLVKQTGYQWCRVSYRSIVKKIFGEDSLKLKLTKSWQEYQDVVCIPSHSFGFDGKSLDHLQEVSRNGGRVVISGHPSGLSRDREENINLLITFLEQVSDLQEKGALITTTVSDAHKRVA